MEGINVTKPAVTPEQHSLLISAWAMDLDTLPHAKPNTLPEPVPPIHYTHLVEIRNLHCQANEVLKWCSEWKVFENQKEATVAFTTRRDQVEHVKRRVKLERDWWKLDRVGDCECRLCREGLTLVAASHEVLEAALEVEIRVKAQSKPQPKPAPAPPPRPAVEVNILNDLPLPPPHHQQSPLRQRDNYVPSRPPFPPGFGPIFAQCNHCRCKCPIMGRPGCECCRCEWSSNRFRMMEEIKCREELDQLRRERDEAIQESNQRRGQHIHERDRLKDQERIDELVKLVDQLLERERERTSRKPSTPSPPPTSNQSRTPAPVVIERETHFIPTPLPPRHRPTTPHHHSHQHHHHHQSPTPSLPPTLRRYSTSRLATLILDQKIDSLTCQLSTLDSDISRIEQLQISLIEQRRLLVSRRHSHSLSTSPSSSFAKRLDQIYIEEHQLEIELKTLDESRNALKSQLDEFQMDRRRQNL